MANHASFSVGSTIRFVTLGNVVVERTLLAKFNAVGTDFSIGALSAELPDTIARAQVLPADWEEYVPHPGELIALCTEKERKAFPASVVRLEPDSASFRRVPFGIMTEFFEFLQAGDSGCPAFLVVGNAVVLLTTWVGFNAFLGGGIGNFITAYLDEVNAAIAAVDALAGISTGYTLTTADLSEFPSY